MKKQIKEMAPSKIIYSGGTFRYVMEDGSIRDAGVNSLGMIWYVFRGSNEIEGWEILHKDFSLMYFNKIRDDHYSGELQKDIDSGRIVIKDFKKEVE